MGDVLQLDNEKQLLKQYYAGQQMPSPNGGFLMLLGVRAGEGGKGVAIFECSVSSLRYEIHVPKATRADRKKVKEEIDAGREPGCPRHGETVRLVRRGKDYVCLACGIPYGKA